MARIKQTIRISLPSDLADKFLADARQHVKGGGTINDALGVSGEALLGGLRVEGPLPAPETRLRRPARRGPVGAAARQH